MSKGCIQIQIGDRKYTFRDVDVKPTSLNSILTSLVRNKKFNSNIEDILSIGNQDVNKIISEGGDVSTNIGDFAVGNANGANLATLSKINKSTDFNAVSSIVSLINYSDNAFMFSSSTDSSTAYIGNKRDFILLNPSIIDSGSALSQAIAFKYASKESTKKNSPIFRTLSKYVNIILESDHPFKSSLEGVSDVTAAKKLLILAQNDNSELSQSLLKELGAIIKSKADKKLDIKAKSVLDNRISSITKYGNSITVINGHKYTNSNIIELLQKVLSYKGGATVDESLFPENVPTKFKEFYTENSDGKYGQLINDLLFGEELDVANLFVPDINTTVNNIVEYLYKVPEDVTEDSSYIPRIGKVEIEDNYQVDEKAVILNTNNGILNSIIKSPNSVEVILDNSIGKFASVKKTETRVKILINPSFEISENDIKEIKSAISVKTGKNAGTSNKKNSWYILKQKSVSSASALNGLYKLFDQLNVNQTLVNSVYSTAYDDFSLQVAKAANQAGINVNIFPDYYPINRPKGEFLSYLDRELNLSFAKSEIEKSFTAEEYGKFTSDENPGLFYNLIKKRVGDIVTVKNSITQDKGKFIIDKIYSFKFNPGMNKFTDMYNSNIGGFNLGSVFSLLLDGKRKTGVLIKRGDSNYEFLLENGDYVSIPMSEVNSLESEHAPLYLSDARIIGSDKYYNTTIGLVKNGVLFKNNVTELRNFYSKELKEIFEKTIYSDYTEFLDKEFGSKDNFGNKKFYIFSPYTRENISKIDAKIPNYSNINMLEILGNSIKKLGIRVDLFSSDQISALFGSGLAENKAFIHNGGIIINSTKSTADSPIHELMHLLMAQYKATNPEGYYKMLNSVPEMPQFEELKQRYRELSPNDYTEEVLVHAMTDYFMDRVTDYGPLNFSEYNFDIKSIAAKLLNVDEKKINSYRNNSDFMNTLLRTLLLDGDSKLLNNLTLGVNLDQTITEGRVSNIKSDLIKKDNLKIDCQ